MKRALILSSVVVAGVVVLTACEKSEPERPEASREGTLPPPPPPASSSGGPAEGGCGFPSTPSVFTLPVVPGVPYGSFTQLDATIACTNGRPFAYQVRDMTGDQQPDLVATSACDDTTIGPLAWRVYENIGTGFAAEPIRFTLPLPRLPECAKTELVDLDGDLKPDLVTTSLCTDASVGTTQWLVNRNNGAGFDPITSFALPTGLTPGSFTALSAPAPECPAGRPAFRALDIDGDRKLDLVVTQVCNDTAVGTSEWRVYKGGAGGFASTPSRFTLPTTPAPTLLMYTSPTSADAACDASALSRTYRLVDLDGDFAPEMVVTSLCNDTTVGTTRWLAYENVGTGFEGPIALDLPVVPGVRGAFTDLAGPAACESGKPGFEVLDVTGDLRRDLLVTRSCLDRTSGVTRWLLHRHGDEKSGLSLARDAVTFSLPPALGGTSSEPIGLDAERRCTGTRRPRFTSTYLVNRRLDLVVTEACQDNTVGATRWLLYEAGCR
ncbi:MAG: VCBS repeat-containing protein [Deltaproteobacteria bacterium]|nr:VCBS repeat-containing protein [Deltaproteobacteria bacterium]